MTESPIRVLLAKVGLDGHDRGIKVVARTLRDAGAEVIYTGLWQSPAAVVRAAQEEDVDVIGVSMLSAAHMTLVPQLLSLLKEATAHPLPVVVGGIIPPEDSETLRSMGVSAVLGPEASLTTVEETVKTLARQHRSGDYRANEQAGAWRETLAKTLTGVGEETQAQEPHRAYWVGVTGPPGVGKSTLIGKLITELRGRGKKVAVLAVDPSSPISGGALLGDRARMNESSDDADIFVRSIAARGKSGGLAGSLPGMLAIIDQHDFDIVLIETVGTGQADYDVCRLADTSLLLFMPGAGDELQLEKAGVIEVADIIVINKADRPEADKLFAEARETLGRDRKILKVSAQRNDGISELADAVLGAGP